MNLPFCKFSHCQSLLGHPAFNPFFVFRFQPSIHTCNFSGFDSDDYEECRLLGYNNPVRTSQGTHYVSATELSRLMLCKI
jgi:hypothetical protein